MKLSLFLLALAVIVTTWLVYHFFGPWFLLGYIVLLMVVFGLVVRRQSNILEAQREANREADANIHG